MFDTPILLIAFNRPLKLVQVLDKIHSIQPRKVYIVVDGPRKNNDYDQAQCELVREIIKNLNWESEIHYKFRDINLGCGRGPADAISWFFSQEEDGIILEDDCLPHVDFFYYCQELLQLYRYNSRIFFIGGTNFQNITIQRNSSYYFTSGNQGTWGWATWRRGWLNFNYYLYNVDFKNIEHYVYEMYPKNSQRRYWKSIFEHVKLNQYDDTCWDYQFYFNVWSQRGLAITPAVNLVSNIGFDSEGTHTLNNDHAFSNNNSYAILPLIHPDLVIHDQEYDLFLFTKFLKNKLTFYVIIKQCILRFINLFK